MKVETRGTAVSERVSAKSLTHRTNAPREADVQRAILDLLAAYHIPAFRMNTGAVSASHNGKRRFFRFGTPGMADILAAPRTKHFSATENAVLRAFLWIECKGADGRQTPEQKAFQQYATENEMHYLVARSMEEVEVWLREHGAI